MTRPNARRALLAVAIVVVLLVLGLYFWPRAPQRTAGRTPPARASVAAQQAGAADAAGAPVKEARLLTIEDFPELQNAPPNCKQIVLWHRRNAPAWTIEKNMDAQAMMFDETEMACLNEMGVPDQILVRAEAHRKVPQPAVPR